ncbi:MAG: hypothetical protein ABGZ35_31310, partial [Planctomycetaceae bacterium]
PYQGVQIHLTDDHGQTRLPANDLMNGRSSETVHIVSELYAHFGRKPDHDPFADNVGQHLFGLVPAFADVGGSDTRQIHGRLITWRFEPHRRYMAGPESTDAAELLALSLDGHFHAVTNRESL